MLKVVMVAVVAVGLISLTTLATPALGATLTVTRTDDPAPDGCQPGNCSLREAILAANDSGGADTITLPAGTFTIDIDGAGENDGLTGDFDITGGVTIQGAGGDQTIIDAMHRERIFDIFPDSNTSITGVTLTNGQTASGGDGGQDCGWNGSDRRRGKATSSRGGASAQCSGSAGGAGIERRRQGH